MEDWTAAMAIPPSAEECNVFPGGTLPSTPSSSTSGCISADDSSDSRHVPTSLTPADCQLLLHNEATVEELQRAIDRCKELVLDTEHCSEERKWVVRHLIELRLRLQERREADDDPEHPLNVNAHELARVVLGHHFRSQTTKSSVTSGKVYCDQCARVIWTMLQAWYICEDCGFASHHKCVGEVIRVCAQVRAAEHPQYELEICPEDGLHLQNHRCAECSVSITIGSMDASWNEARLCDYDGKYYCPRCHWNTAMPIPARIVHNWDLEPRRICQSCAQLLRLTYKRPMLALASLNQRLFGLVHELSLAQKHRDQIISMRRYLVHCRFANEKHVLSALGACSHMAEGCLSTETASEGTSPSVHLYSMQDLIDIENGNMAKTLQDIINVFVKHIKVECTICTGRGHLCELCGNSDILYPFDEGAITCQQCGAVFHRACWTVKRRRCTKCLRRNRRKEIEVEEQICDQRCRNNCLCSTNVCRETPRPS